MRVVVQRVSSASCYVDGSITGSIKRGLLLLTGFSQSDTKETVLKLAKKVKKLRIFSDEDGKMNLNIDAVSGSILSISQFTLYGSLKKTNRPSFTDSMNFSLAEEFYDLFNFELRNIGLDVEQGIFWRRYENKPS